MKKIITSVLVTFLGIGGVYSENGNIFSEETVRISLDDCVLIKYPVPEKGIVCSNYERVLRIGKRLQNPVMHTSAWGPCVVIGEYKGERIFVACAPIGSGSGLMFTELFAAGAKYILRYGSDDVKSPPSSDAYLVKIVDEADNLFGFAIQSGVDPEEYGHSLSASAEMLKALFSTAENKGIVYEKRICHHLENYHALRLPGKFPSDKRDRIEEILSRLESNPKPASYDMETAVLFRVAKDFGLHAATVLQTVNKENPRFSAYEGENYQEARNAEEAIFFDYVLDALLAV